MKLSFLGLLGVSDYIIARSRFEDAAILYSWHKDLLPDILYFYKMHRKELPDRNPRAKVLDTKIYLVKRAMGVD